MEINKMNKNKNKLNVEDIMWKLSGACFKTIPIYPFELLICLSFLMVLFLFVCTFDYFTFQHFHIKFTNWLCGMDFFDTKIRIFMLINLVISYVIAYNTEDTL